MQVTELSREDYEHALQGLGVNPPIEQTPVWQDYESTISGREFWGYVSFVEGGETLAVCALSQYETHGYRFLRGHHGPVWRSEPTAEQEAAALEALASFAHGRDKGLVFIRIAVLHELPLTHPVLSTMPYDTTVVMDVTGGEDGILSRMKPRGRRDVRKALRECPASCADETDRAASSFGEYYRIMQETGERDGFAPAPLSDYQSMVAGLGPDHCRVFAARTDDGVLLAWSLMTMNGGMAVRYYAATTHEAGRLRVADKLVLFEALAAAGLGCDAYDLMGIGSEFSPETMNLNEFKTKFAKDGVRHIAPDRDVPLRYALYRALVGIKALRVRRRHGA